MNQKPRYNITFKVTPEQHRQVSQTVKERNISVSDLMREILFDEKPKQNFQRRLSKKEFIEKYKDGINYFEQGKTTKQISILLDASVTTITKFRNYAIEEGLLDPIYKTNDPQIISMYLKQQSNIDYLRQQINNLQKQNVSL
jgi:hypothetical protein